MTAPAVVLPLALAQFVASYAASNMNVAISAGKDPLFSITLFHSRTSNLGLLTQNIQWLVLQGSFFVISVFLRQIRGYSAITTGLMLVPATVGILVASGAAERMARRHSRRRLIRAGFSGTVTGIVLLLLSAREDSGVLSYVPGLLMMGLGIGIMLTASVNLVQSAWPEELEGDVSGLSRCVSNLGSSMGTALAGSVLVGATRPGGGPFALALVVLAGFALIGLIASVLLPKHGTKTAAQTARS